MHETSIKENLVIQLTKFKMTCSKIIYMVYKFFGMGHIGEEFAVKVTLSIAFTPVLLLIILLTIDYFKGVHNKEVPQAQNKVKD